MAELATNNPGNRTPEKNFEMAIKNTKNPSVRGYCLSMSCPGIQTETLVKIILDDYPQDMLVDQGQTLTGAIEQSLRVLQRIRQTFICFDYKGAKARVLLDMLNSEITPERGTIIISGNKELDSLSEFVIDNVGDIHLPNGILKVGIEPGRESGEFVFKAKKYYSGCDRAKRGMLRVELNGDHFARGFFKPIAKANGDAGKPKQLPDNDYPIQTENGVKIGIVKNISDLGLGIYIPKIGTSSLEPGKTFKLVLPFFDPPIKVDFTVKKINREHDNCCELGGAMYYINPKDKEKVEKFVWATNKKIGEEFNSKKAGYEGIEKIEIKPKDL